MNIIPTEASLGARVSDVDLRTLSADQWQTLYSAWLDFAVLIFPGQYLGDDEQVEFSKRFGRLERSISHRAKQAEISSLSNLDPATGSAAVDGSSLDLFLKGNRFWHTDSSFKALGAKASLLGARVLPSAGGDTEFADMRAAWDVLDQESQQNLSNMYAVHSYRYSQSLVGGMDILSAEDWKGLPPVLHPVVLDHPETGRKVLYVGRHASHIPGLPQSNGRQLLKMLTEDACRSPRLLRHRWQAGDLVVWDNRSVLHRGHSWPDGEVRSMHRTTVAGDGDNPWAIEEAI